MKKILSIAMALGIATATAPALAAGSATLQQGQSTRELSWLDNGSVRFDMGPALGYMLARDGKAYMVNTQAGSGMPPVMEIGGAMQDMVQAFSKNRAQPPGKIQSAKATGKKETVAGIVGEVFDITVSDANGNAMTQEVVLTSDPRVVEMTAAFMGISSALVGPAGVKTPDQLPAGKRGLLRWGDDYALQSISGKSPAADLFKLPAKPVDMQEMMQDMLKHLPRQ